MRILLKLISVICLLIASAGAAGLVYGMFNDIRIALISLAVVIIGTIAWYVFRNWATGLEE